MTNNKHTPGPWNILLDADTSEPQIYSADQTMQCKVYGANERANVRLIAAAPELLAALQSFCKWAEAHRDEAGAPMRSAPYREARAAIAKATKS